MQFFKYKKQVNIQQAFKPLIVTACLLMTACQTSHQHQENALRTAPPTEKASFKVVDFKQKAEAAQLLRSDAFLRGADAIFATKKNGILVLNKAGETISQYPGYFTTLDHRASSQGLLVASVDGNLQQVLLTNMLTNTQAWSNPLIVPKPNFKIEGACLYQDSAKNTFVFLVGEEGLGEQWLVGHETTLLKKASLVRSLSLPPASGYCQVDDKTDTLYVNEENVGIWGYAANAEAELARKPIAMLKPFGDIAKNASGMALIGNQVMVLDADSKALHRYQVNPDNVVKLISVDFPSLNTPENLSVRMSGNKLDILVKDDTGIHIATIPNQMSAAKPLPSPLPVVKPMVQTDLMPSLGDAADDPAIWVHPKDATKSLVLGTDKRGGLAVYNLQGEEVQYLPVGRLNNVDIRSGFNLNGTLIDLAVASNRDNNSLHIFSIDRDNGQLQVLSEQPTTIKDIYGICMFKDKQNRFYSIVNDKDGTFEQYNLTTLSGNVVANKVRTFKVETQPEACVVDDQSEQLFVGEEDAAVWSLNAGADSPTQLTKVISTGGIVHADIEGIAYYRGKKHSYLVVSSQGNDSYVVLDAQPPYKIRGAFTVGLNASLGIDGASETDGLEVTSSDLSGNNTGIWRLGMLVVQDGRKRLPVGTQNFKYIPWTAIADALKLEP